MAEQAKMLLARILDATEEAQKQWIVACGAMPLGGITPGLAYYVAETPMTARNPVIAFQSWGTPNLCIDFARGKAMAKRLELYGKLGISEVWAWNDATPVCKMTGFGLKPSGKYVKLTSPTIAANCMTLSELGCWISMGNDVGGRNMIRNLRAFLKDRLKK